MGKVLNNIYNWIDKIGKHNFLLMVFILIVFLITGLYTTFSIVTSTDQSEIIDDLLTYKFILNADSDTNNITIAAGSSKLIDITVSNKEDTKLKYGIYYSSSDDISDINLGHVENSTYPSTGLIEGKSDCIVTIKIDNNSESNVTINFELAFGLENGGDLISSNGATLVEEYLYPKATTYINNLYNKGEASDYTTVNIGGDTSKPTVTLNTSQSIMLDNNGEYRYYGAKPNNYVSFNGELWRIIALSNVKSSDTDTTGEQRARIIRDESIGNHSWDYYKLNNWTYATLNDTLNNFYYNQTASGTCYLNGSQTTCDYSENGEIKGLSTDARTLIDNALWYLGGSDDVSSGLYADDWYTIERGNNVYEFNPTTWTGRVGLMYPSDYMYAANLNICTDNSYGYTSDNCKGTDWLYNNEITQWTITHYLDSAYVYYISSSGLIYAYTSGNYTGMSYAVRPVVVLKSNVRITGGDGTSKNPYKLSISE